MLDGLLVKELGEGVLDLECNTVELALRIR